MKNKTIALFFTLFGFLSVGLGAFAAHGLAQTLSEKYLTVFKTGVTYQFYHTFALGLIVVLKSKVDSAYLSKAALAFVIGIFLFSGSLYILSLTQIKWLGMITPLGGVSFLVGWLFLFWHFLKCD